MTNSNSKIDVDALLKEVKENLQPNATKLVREINDMERAQLLADIQASLQRFKLKQKKNSNSNSNGSVRPVNSSSNSSSNTSYNSMSNSNSNSNSSMTGGKKKQCKSKTQAKRKC